MFDCVFKNKTVNFSKLSGYGFKMQDNIFEYKTILSASGFELAVYIDLQGNVLSKVTDCETGEPYTLYLDSNAVGNFVGSVRENVESELTKIANTCFYAEIFKTTDSKAVIEYVRERYGDELEFLWEKFSGNAVWRRKDNKKWYAVMLTISKSKLGVSSDETVEIIDFRMNPDELDNLADNKTYFRGYHMNKKHWCTVVLDGSVPVCEICKRIDESYKLAK